MFQEIAPHQYHIEYTPRAPRPGDLFTAADEGRLLVLSHFGESTGGNAAADAMQELKPERLLPTVGEAVSSGIVPEEETLTYLFSVDDTAYYSRVWEKVPAPPKTVYLPTGNLRRVRPHALSFPAMMGHQLIRWYQRNRFCGACGEKTVQDEKERALRCPSCGNLIYPSFNVGVIVGIKNGDSLLVTRYAGRPAGSGYALVAGYVESGETPEDTVRREVMEEVGLKVKNLRYYKSQPWAFSSTLLLGFYCELSGGSRITLQEDELAFAAFKKRDELPEDVDKVSLTAEMIDRFRRGEEI
ncbi:MAG: NAD(+) diphosphatase [Lachnospiraceae bacterium]|nr:NAD(+) diphosphatase [Lachnospiraceae bacterium]